MSRQRHQAGGSRSWDLRHAQYLGGVGTLHGPRQVPNSMPRREQPQETLHPGGRVLLVMQQKKDEGTRRGSYRNRSVGMTADSAWKAHIGMASPSHPSRLQGLLKAPAAPPLMCRQSPSFWRRQPHFHHLMQLCYRSSLPAYPAYSRLKGAHDHGTGISMW